MGYPWPGTGSFRSDAYNQADLAAPQTAAMGSAIEQDHLLERHAPSVSETVSSQKRCSIATFPTTQDRSLR